MMVLATVSRDSWQRGVLPPTGSLPGASFLLPLDFIGNLIGFTGIPNILAKDFEKDLLRKTSIPTQKFLNPGYRQSSLGIYPIFQR